MSAPRALRSVTVAVVTGTLLVAMAAAALAHPLGNFTVNTFMAVTVEPESTTIDYVLDLAEIPALQARQRLDADNDGDVGEAESATEERQGCQRIADQLTATVDGRDAALSSEPGTLTFPDGEAGLTTMRLECRYEVATGALSEPTQVVVTDNDDSGRVGWHEAVARGQGVTLTDSDVPEASISDRLRAYPEDRLAAPLDVRSAELTVRPGAEGTPSAASVPGGIAPGVDRLTSAFTGLVSDRELTPTFGMFAVLLAVVLGGLHALAPGHGKTIMAAYIVGQRGSLRQILGIGVTVALTHTAGVLALGLALTVSTSLAPERLYPWFGVASGALVVAIGLRLLLRAVRRRLPAAADARASGHVDHGHDHPHEVGGIHAEPGQREPHEHERGHAHAGAVATATHVDDGLTHDHGGSRHTHVLPAPDENLRWREYVALGFAGGMVPSPSALVVLLGALALGRAAFGVGLVIAYGIGLAATLVVAGLLLVRARGWLAGWFARSSGPRRPWLARLAGALPMITAGVVVAGGLLLTTRSLAGVS
jgi:ABC-type nickel/cobalt efflux system permease component RcnA